LLHGPDAAERLLMLAPVCVVCVPQVVSFDNLEDQELEKREVAEGWFLLRVLGPSVDN